MLLSNLRSKAVKSFTRRRKLRKTVLRKTHFRHMFDTCSTHFRQISDTFPTHFRHMFDTFPTHFRKCSRKFQDDPRNFFEIHRNLNEFLFHTNHRIVCQKPENVSEMRRKCVGNVSEMCQKCAPQLIVVKFFQLLYLHLPPR